MISAFSVFSAWKLLISGVQDIDRRQIMRQRLIEILRIALRNHVTDIHFDLKEDGSLVIEMRVGDQIRKLRPAGDDAHFFHYLMYRANLDLSSAMEPQTGSFEEDVDGTTLALRFALVSSYHVTSGVLRILNNHGVLTSDHLSCLPWQNAWLQSVMHHRDGLVVFSGPTGSGKTTTLYTLLNEISGKKIFTLEDPIEIYSEKYVQLAVNEKRHFSYADGIRQLMRHDPDIIMIGEIRDEQAAQMAVRCALTGHLVVTSLHAGSCTIALERLMDLGVRKAQLADVLRGVFNQRLFDSTDGRKTCIYEYMNHQEVMNYFNTGTCSDRFTPLSTAIASAVHAGFISMEEAQEDLD